MSAEVKEGRGKDLLEICLRAVEIAKRYGAQEVSADAARMRELSVAWRDGAIEKVTEATSREIGMALYVDGRYSVASTSDVRPEALDRFIADAVALARALTADPHRRLPDPELYANRPEVDLELEDPDYQGLTAARRRELAEEIEVAARAERGSAAILSVTSSVSDSWGQSVKVTSNGFQGVRHGTSYWIGAEVSVKDTDGRRPEDAAFAGARFRTELPTAKSIGTEASRRAHARLGSVKGESGKFAMAIENRSASRMVGALLGPLGAASLQQKRSFMEGKLGTSVAAERLTIIDEPLIKRGFGSRLYDGQGISAKRMPIIEGGVLKTYFVDTYYGKKLGMPPTTGSSSNITFVGGSGNQAQILAGMGDGIFVTGFLGGNTNASTGDFSLGVQGHRVRGGKIAEPVSEMNISGNQLDLWQHLVSVGADPYPYSSVLTPTLVFDGVSFAGQ